MSEESVKEVVENIREDPYRVELSRGMKGQYGWSLRVSGKSREEVLKEIQALDTSLRQSYGSP